MFRILDLGLRSVITATSDAFRGICEHSVNLFRQKYKQPERRSGRI